jgi:hypothetical protein
MQIYLDPAVLKQKLFARSRPATAWTPLYPAKIRHFFSVSTEIVGKPIGIVIPCRPTIAGYGRKKYIKITHD